MRELTALALALAFVGITFAQQVSPDPRRPIGGQRHQMALWCSQNWEQCRQMKLEDLFARMEDLLARKECLENSQSYQAYRECEFMRRYGDRLR